MSFNLFTVHFYTNIDVSKQTQYIGHAEESKRTKTMTVPNPGASRSRPGMGKENSRLFTWGKPRLNETTFRIT